MPDPAITYLCGGINGLSDSQCSDWRDVARRTLNTDTLDPMRRDYRGREGNFVNDIVEGDLQDIEDSDFVLVNATRPSWGTAMEIVYAYDLDKYIVAFVGDTAGVSPWLQFHCKIARTIEEAVALLNQRAAHRMTPPNGLFRRLLHRLTHPEGKHCESYA